MPFQPNVDDKLTIDEVEYRFAGHPGAPGMPYGQEGRQGIVYKLLAPATGQAPSPVSGEGRGGGRALKAFKPRYRLPGLVALADHIGSFATLSGLEVCRRSVLTPRRHASLLHEHPDLVYAVVMPWIEGPTWMEVMLDKRELSGEQSLELARALVELLVSLEQRSMAHCDLSGPNVLLPALATADGRRPASEGDESASAGRRPPAAASAVALVDVEQMYAPGLEKPELLPGGSLGYAQHRTATEGLWESKADRYAGAVLVAEMLSWCDERVRQAAWGENYFDPQEMQAESERAQVLGAVLRERWGAGAAGLFERAWRSETLGDCATFGEWRETLASSEFRAQSSETASSEAADTLAPSPLAGRAAGGGSPDAAARALVEAARRLEQQGDRVAALGVYRQAQALAAPDGQLALELENSIRQLEAQSATAASGRAASAAAGRPAPATDPASLFEEGRKAYERREWARARELLAEVVRQKPDFVRDKQPAAKLLQEAERRAQGKGPPIPWRWVLSGAFGFIALGLVLGGAAGAGPLGPLIAPPTPTLVPTPTEIPTPTPTIVPTPTSTTVPPTPTLVPPTSTPTIDQVWQTTLGALEEPWGKDWPRAITIIDLFRGQHPSYRPADEKLYAALVFYGEQLVRERKTDDAIKQFVRAQALFPARGEAGSALRALTPTPAPRR
jgi:tetratricopeptide (TPR) repeat protein